MSYPMWDTAISGGVLMGVVAIAHVLVSHFAIGGGLVIAASETLAVRRGDHELRELARRSSLVLILVSTVFGAISGVGIWVVAGLIAPATISALIRNYVWGWAIEWVFFLVEIIAALVYYTTWNRISKKAHVLVGWIYFVTAYLSLVVINGIITFMLTPGEWLATGRFWDGFFNPTYWPSLVLRTGIVLIMATALMVFPALKASPEARPRLARWLGWWLLAGTLVAYGGYRWWETALPETVRAIFLGESPVLTGLATTRQLTLWALAATMLLGIVFLTALPRVARPVVALLILIASATFFGGYERLREGARKPFLIHGYMFSNGLRISEIAGINESGLAQHAPWVAHGTDGDPVALGRRIFRAQCAGCHTIDGYQPLREAIQDPDAVEGLLFMLREQGETYVGLEPGQRVDPAELYFSYMPPFVGTDDEMAALVDYLRHEAETGPAVADGGERP